MLMRTCLIALTLGVQALASSKAQHGLPTSSRRSVVLQVLSTGKPRGNVRLTEDLVAEADRWFWNGDHSVLVPLLRAASHTDGASAEMLGCVLGEILMKKPRMILEAAAGQPNEVMQRACDLAVAADGGGHAPEEVKVIRANLQKASADRDARIAQTAKLWLAGLDRFAQQNKP